MVSVNASENCALAKSDVGFSGERNGSDPEEGTVLSSQA